MQGLLFEPLFLSGTGVMPDLKLSNVVANADGSLIFIKKFVTVTVTGVDQEDMMKESLATFIESLPGRKRGRTRKTRKHGPQKVSVAPTLQSELASLASWIRNTMFSLDEEDARKRFLQNVVFWSPEMRVNLVCHIGDNAAAKNSFYTAAASGAFGGTSWYQTFFPTTKTITVRTRKLWPECILAAQKKTSTWISSSLDTPEQAFNKAAICCRDVYMHILDIRYSCFFNSSGHVLVGGVLKKLIDATYTDLQYELQVLFPNHVLSLSMARCTNFLAEQAYILRTELSQ